MLILKGQLHLESANPVRNIASALFPAVLLKMVLILSSLNLFSRWVHKDTSFLVHKYMKKPQTFFKSKMYFYKSSSWSILRKMKHDRQGLTGWVQMGMAERTEIQLCIWIMCKKVAKCCLMAIRLCFRFVIDHLWSFSLQIVLQSLQKGVITTVGICSLCLDSKMPQQHQEEKACLQR